jgi:serine/threonine protein kinase
VGKAGTYPYIAPETLLQGKCTPASDIFSLALLMWELIEGEIPFHDMPNLDGMLPILWQDGRRPPMESANFEQAPRMLRSLIERCWLGDRRRRPTAAQVVDALDELAPEFGMAPIGSAAGESGEGGAAGIGGEKARSTSLSWWR